MDCVASCGMRGQPSVTLCGIFRGLPGNSGSTWLGRLQPPAPEVPAHSHRAPCARQTHVPRPLSYIMARSWHGRHGPRANREGPRRPAPRGIPRGCAGFGVIRAGVRGTEGRRRGAEGGIRRDAAGRGGIPAMKQIKPGHAGTPWDAAARAAARQEGESRGEEPSIPCCMAQRFHARRGLCTAPWSGVRKGGHGGPPIRSRMWPGGGGGSAIPKRRFRASAMSSKQAP